MDEFDLIRARSAARPDRPLTGLTVLVVEDSRFACEALRLLCLRSGARIRRADCLESARRHLRAYRPSVVIVDLGLPDGAGDDLIRELRGANPRITTILGTSGDPDGAAIALDAGADAFLAKPVESLAVFQSVVLENLPPELSELRSPVDVAPPVEPDEIAFQDDLAYIAGLLGKHANQQKLRYAASFLSGLARSVHDKALERAATDLVAQTPDPDSAKPVAATTAAGAAQARLYELVHDRLQDRPVI